MENENKSVKENTENKNTPRNHHGHGKHNRSRGYFITPAQNGENKPSPEVKQQEKPREEPKKKPENKPQSPAPKTANTENGEQKSHNRNHHRRRHGHGGNRPQQKSNGEQAVTDRNVQAAPAKKEQKKQGQLPRTEHTDSSSTVPSNTSANNTRKAPRPTRNPSPGYTGLSLRETLDEPTPLAIQEPEEETVDPSTISPDILETPHAITVAEDDEVARIEVVGIRFKSSGKIYYFDPAGKSYTRGNYAIVETARGLEYGEIALANTMVKETDVVPPLRPILRTATDIDRARHEENRKKEADALKICEQKIAEHKLDMKLIEAQYTFDNSKLLFYFTSAGRVDFRELVKDLASVFRTRIELRQIGIRDEAKMMGGLGLCGRPLCCSVFLSDFCQVSIKMAKEQNFSLNSSKISGMCGRLMCCLRFEHETYEYEIKRTPPVDSVVQTPDGNGVVIENSPLVGTVKVRLSVTPEVAPKVYHRDDVVVLQRKQPNPNNEKSENNSNKKNGR